MTAQLVDSHAHLNDPRFEADLPDVLRQANEAGVTKVVNVGVNAEVSRTVVGLAREVEGVFAAAGFHPSDLDGVDGAGLEAVEGLLQEPEVVAVGETGLDFYRDYAPHDLQERIFRRHVRMALEAGLPLVVHSRGAEDRVLAILESEGAGSVGGVLHCFGGTLDQARQAVDLGFHLGFGGTITFPKSSALTVALGTPGDRILLETDCPYLAPQPRRGRRNEPAFVRFVAECLSTAFGETLDSVAERTTANAVALFRLPAP